VPCEQLKLRPCRQLLLCGFKHVGFEHEFRQMAVVLSVSRRLREAPFSVRPEEGELGQGSPLSQPGRTSLKS
jgi:hypothetical protein